MTTNERIEKVKAISAAYREKIKETINEIQEAKELAREICNTAFALHVAHFVLPDEILLHELTHSYQFGLILPNTLVRFVNHKRGIGFIMKPNTAHEIDREGWVYYISCFYSVDDDEWTFEYDTANLLPRTKNPYILKYDNFCHTDEKENQLIELLPRVVSDLKKTQEILDKFILSYAEAHNL